MSCWCGEHSGSASRHYKRGEKPCEAAYEAKRKSRAKYRDDNRAILNQRQRVRRSNPPEAGWIVGSDIMIEEFDPL